jgi:sugar/nucleoside kinase (ribokinase family)
MRNSAVKLRLSAWSAGRIRAVSQTEHGTIRIDCRGLCLAEHTPTTLAFVQLNDRGDRSFLFYRNPGADTELTWDGVDKTLLENCRIFHFGGVSLTDEPCRTATLKAAEYAKSAGRSSVMIRTTGLCFGGAERRQFP